MRLSTIVAILVAVLFGGFAAFSAKAWLKGRAVAGVPSSVPTTTLVVAAQPLAFGAELTAENTTEIPWTAGALPQGAIAQKTALLKDGRRVALTPIEKNEPILEWKITGPGQRASLSALVAEGMKAVTVRVDDVKGVAGFVLPGDRVDVILTQEETRQDNRRSSSADVLLQNVRVLAVDQVANEKQEKPTLAKAVTVEVSTEQAQKVVLASTIGKLALILRQAGSAQSDKSRRITAADLSPAAEPVVTAKAEPAKVEPAKAEPTPARAQPEPPPFATIGVVRGMERNVYNVVKEPVGSRQPR